MIIIFTGLTALIALGILDQLEAQGKIKSLLELEHNSAEYLHALVETLRYVYLATHQVASNLMLLLGLPSQVLFTPNSLLFPSNHELLDTQYYVSDPAVHPVPVEKLLSKVSL